MKYNVRYSAWSWFWSVCGTLILVSLTIYWFIAGNIVSAWILTGLVGLLAVFALIYAPLYLAVNSEALIVRRPLFTRRIPLTEIKSVDIITPTMGAKRIAGSGGWFGYWGWFREADIDRYFAYYGKASDCFLVTLRNGRKYMLGCETPRRLIGELDMHLSRL